MKIFSILFFGLVLMLVFGCGGAAMKNEQASEKGEGKDMTAPRPESTKPEAHLYFITLDKFKLRDQPNQTGKVVHQFALGEFVEGTGKISDQKETIEIGGMPYHDHWFEVVSTTLEQKRGWVFGGGALRIYAGPRAVLPDLGKLTEFTMFLKKQGAKKYGSGKMAWDYVRANFGDSHGTLADAVFLILEDFLQRIDQENALTVDMNQKINPQTDEDWFGIMEGSFDMNRTPFTKELDAARFRLDATEGSVFALPDLRKMKEFFVGKVTPPMKTYLEQIAREQSDRETEDAGITIAYRELADRAVFWEIFNADHPYFVQCEEAQNFEKWKRWLLIVGMDNTPAFDYETGGVAPDFRKSWDNILQKYPGTELAKKVKEFDGLIASEGGKKTKKVEDWMAKFTEETSN